MQPTKTYREAFCVVVQFWLLSFLAAASSTNVATLGTAVQSSVASGGNAQRAIDGNTNPDYRAGSCTHTSSQANPWWRLNLPGVYRISHIKITNRIDVSERLNGAEILIGNSADDNGNTNQRCAVIASIPSAQSHTFQCGGMEGLFVNVYLPGSGKILSLCEVEVYAEEVPPPPTFTAVVGQRNVTVVGLGPCKTLVRQLVT
ncbi:fucolectin-like [Genypterus blacodes]|uniref:fucolectin-like n=1 Tax=Genypterus blacodes TaxID=154954 RepID=UPI003F774703